MAYFKALFGDCITAAAPSADLPTRLKNIGDVATQTIFTAIQRSLCEEHKLLFAFLTAIALSRAAGDVAEADWSLFLYGAALPAAQRSQGRSTTRQASSRGPSWRAPNLTRGGLVHFILSYNARMRFQPR